MKWYPWLNNTYQQIITCYQKKKGHHALLLHSQKGNGEESLFYALSRWLICIKPIGIKSCNICHSCQLIKSGNHPDYYSLELEKEKNSFGIDSILVIINKLHNYACQGGAKVIYCPNISIFTEQSMNALLKTLEEPPIETYFLLGCQDVFHVLPTVFSRCLYWFLPTPNEEFGVYWLKRNNNYESQSVITALRLCNRSILEAQELLQPKNWKNRLMFCKILEEVVDSGNFLELLPVLNQNQNNLVLYWLLNFLIDALKLEYVEKKFLVNQDKIELVISLKIRCSREIINYQLYKWQIYLRQLYEISNINRELLLTRQLLDWEEMM